MTPQERDLIESVFSRLAQVSGQPKDAEALALIADRMRAQPDAAYGLVQAVLVLETTLKQAQTHIADLERRLAEGPGAPTSGSFLGAANPWAQNAPRPAPQPAYQQQPVQQPSPWGQPAGGGFLRQAATAAAGVAGGVLLAEGISSLFSGHRGGWGGYGYGDSLGFGGAPEPVENVTVNNYYGDSSGDDSQTADYSTDDSFGSSGDDDSWM